MDGTALETRLHRERQTMNSSTDANNMGAGLAIGCGLGAAIGVALGNIAVGIAVGVALGVAIGSSGALNKKSSEG